MTRPTITPEPLAMIKKSSTSYIVAAAAAGVLSVAFSIGGYAAPLSAAPSSACDLTAYKPAAGLSATSEPDGVSVAWDGDKNQEVRLHLAIDNRTPIVRQLELRQKGAAWSTIETNLKPEFRVVTGLRRITNQQLDPLAGLGVKITKEVVDRYKWEAFWDAPLNIPGGDSEHNNTTPPQRGVLDQPGLPRSPSEVKRADAAYHVQACDVKTDGARIEISFPGVDLGVFSGRLQYTVFRGTNLIRQEIVAKTEEPSVAYKYDAGISGLAIKPTSRVLWHGLTGLWQEYRFGAAPNDAPVNVKTNNRILAADAATGSIAAFPPPHNFFWARETTYNLGYNWYRKDSDTSFSFGVKQAEAEEPPAEEARGNEDRRQNFALRSARPGTWQRMPVYLYVSAEPASAAVDGALAFTRGDHFKPVPGYQVMATHFHMGLVGKARRAGGLDAVVTDLQVLKEAGVTIVAPIDGNVTIQPVPGAAPGIPGVDNPKWFQWTRGLGAVPEPAGGAASGGGRGGGRGGEAGGRMPQGARGGRAGSDPYKAQADYFETARRQSDKDFIVMPNSEVMRGAVARSLGGHSDVFFSHPVYWSEGRAPGQPFVESNPTYGKVYHVGDTADMMRMTHLENMIIYMPHPGSKGSTGYPDAIADAPHFIDENYRGIGFRWGMGLDGSEQRLCEYRCLPIFDDMNNWVADKPTPPKYIQAISEMYTQGYGDDIYANNPVNYVELASIPAVGDWTPIVDAMKKGDYFVTSGEVLIPSYSVQGSGEKRTISADVEWTFPLEFVEVVWGDGVHTGRQVIPATDLPPFGRHTFKIPFDTAGKKWVRFAVWDTAGNGAMVQPIKLVSPRAASAAR